MDKVADHIEDAVLDGHAVKSNPAIAKVDVDLVNKLKLERYAQFRDRIKHTPKLLQSSAIAAYGAAMDEMSQIMDEARVK